VNNKTYVARQPQQLLAIAALGRDDILDAIINIGPCSIAELARFLGRSRNGLYYHIRALRNCGMLLESYRLVGKQKIACYDVPGRPISVRFELATAASRRAVLALVRARLRSATRAFIRACRADVAVVDGARRNLWGSTYKGWLSDAELQRINEDFLRMITTFRKDAGPVNVERKYYELTFVLAPAVPQPPSGTARRSGRSRKVSVPTNRG
jgi:hypothetical protein